MGRQVSSTKTGFHCAIETTLVEQLKAVAQADDRTLSYVVNKALKEFLNGRQIQNSDPPK